MQLAFINPKSTQYIAHHTFISLNCDYSVQKASFSIRTLKRFAYLKNYFRGVNNFQRIIGLIVIYLKTYQRSRNLHGQFLKMKPQILNIWPRSK